MISHEHNRLLTTKKFPHSSGVLKTVPPQCDLMYVAFFRYQFLVDLTANQSPFLHTRSSNRHSKASGWGAGACSSLGDCAAAAVGWEIRAAAATGDLALLTKERWR